MIRWILGILILFSVQLARGDFQPRWDEIKNLSEKKKQDLIGAYQKSYWKGIAKVATSKKVRNLKDGTSEFLLALALYKENLPVASFALMTHLVDVYPTSPLINQCLELITEVFQTGLIEMSILQEIFDKRILNVTTAEAQALLNYHRFLSLGSKNFRRWARVSLKEIPKETFWEKYFQFIIQVRKSQYLSSKGLLKLWTQFSLREDIPKSLKKWSKINKARALYEMKMYKEAEKIYKTVELNRFDQGVILRERAWIYYHLKQFKEALGVLNQMRTSVYGVYHHIDEYLLAGLIYRETCQEEYLNSFQKDVKRQVDEVKKQIRSMKPYDDIKNIFRFAIYNTSLRKMTRMMTYLNEEKLILKKSSLGSYKKYLKPAFKKLSKFNMYKINERLPEIARHTIEELLVLKEQASYLFYSIRLRRINNEVPKYKKVIKNIRLNLPSTQIVWPVYNEVWNDEVLNYSSVLESRCL